MLKCTTDIAIAHKHIMRKNARHRHVNAKVPSAKRDVQNQPLTNTLNLPKRMLEKSE
jgi:hypothetical protein